MLLFIGMKLPGGKKNSIKTVLCIIKEKKKNTTCHRSGRLEDSVPFHLFGNGGGALAIGKNYARNAQIGKKLRRKII